MRKSFIFYKSFYDSIKELDKEQQYNIYKAVMEHEFEDKEPNLKGIENAIYVLIEPQLNANKKRYENGCKGGRPKNQNKTKTKPKNNQIKTKKKPNENENENENVNENDNVNVNIYGEFKNVKLTDDEYKKLKDKDLLHYIEQLSSYMKSKGKRYKSHYATILNWSRKENKDLPEWFDKDLNTSDVDTKEFDELLNELGG